MLSKPWLPRPLWSSLNHPCRLLRSPYSSNIVQHMPSSRFILDPKAKSRDLESRFYSLKSSFPNWLWAIGRHLPTVYKLYWLCHNKSHVSLNEESKWLWLTNSRLGKRDRNQDEDLRVRRRNNRTRVRSHEECHSIHRSRRYSWLQGGRFDLILSRLYQ